MRILTITAVMLLAPHAIPQTTAQENDLRVLADFDGETASSGEEDLT